MPSPHRRSRGLASARLLAVALAVSAAEAFSPQSALVKYSRLHHAQPATCIRLQMLRVASPRFLSGLAARVGAESIMCRWPEVAASDIKTHFPRTERVVALGDVHGDSYALSTVLWNAGLIDEEGSWAGGEAVLVQVGDILDRGPDEAFCLNLLLRLQQEARQVGGDVIMLLGNHEVMNSDLDYRYVDPLGWLGWDEESDQMLAEQMSTTHEGKKKKPKKDKDAMANWRNLLDRATQLAEMVNRPAVKVLPPFMQGRIKALGGRQGALATLPVAVTVGSTVFCHAGVMPEVVAYGLERLNSETSAYLRGERAKKPLLLDAIPQISPIWHREFGKDGLEFDQRALEAADAAMSLLGAKRMVIGHTPQQRGVNCVKTPEGREIWRIDTGMSQGIAQGPLETLEIASDGLPEEAVQILRGDSNVAAASRTVEAARSLESELQKELKALRKDSLPFAMAESGGSRAKLAPYMRPRIEV